MVELIFDMIFISRHSMSCFFADDTAQSEGTSGPWTSCAQCFLCLEG